MSEFRKNARKFVLTTLAVIIGICATIILTLGIIYLIESINLNLKMEARSTVIYSECKSNTNYTKCSCFYELKNKQVCRYTVYGENNCVVGTKIYIEEVINGICKIPKCIECTYKDVYNMLTYIVPILGICFCIFIAVLLCDKEELEVVIRKNE